MQRGDVISNFFNTSALLLGLILGKLSKTGVSSTLIWKGWGVGEKVVGAKVFLLSSNTVVLNGCLVVVVGASVVLVVGLVLSFGRRRLREKSNFFGRVVVGTSVVLLIVVAASVTTCRSCFDRSLKMVLMSRPLAELFSSPPAGWSSRKGNFFLWLAHLVVILMRMMGMMRKITC